MKHCISLLLIAIALVACSRQANIEDDIRQAEMSIAQGDMIAAKSIADRLTGDKNLSGLDAKQLCRLSMVYMHIAEIDSIQEAATASAADCYMKAYLQSPEATTDYAKTLTETDDYRFLSMLSSIISAALEPISPEEAAIDTDTASTEHYHID